MFQAWRPHPAGACSGVGLPPESRQVYVAVMDLARGSKFAEVGAWAPMHERLRWLAQIADAVAYLQRQDPPVLHRNISPLNIVVPSVPGSSAVVSAKGDESRAVLVDFGLVRVDEPDKSAVWAANLGYCAPEVLADSRRTSMASDVYSLAATACFGIVGEGPRAAPGQLEDRLLRALGTSIERPDMVIGTLRAMLQPDPSARPPAAALSGVLQPQQTMPMGTPPTEPAPTPKPSPPSRRGKLIPALLAGLVVALALALVVAILTRPKENLKANAPGASTSSSAAVTASIPTTSPATVPPSPAAADAVPFTSESPASLTTEQAEKVLVTQAEAAALAEESVFKAPRLRTHEPASYRICSDVKVGQAAGSEVTQWNEWNAFSNPTIGSAVAGFSSPSAAEQFVSGLSEQAQSCGFRKREAGANYGGASGQTVRLFQASVNSPTDDLIIVRKGPNVLQAGLYGSQRDRIARVERLAATAAGRMP